MDQATRLRISKLDAFMERHQALWCHAELADSVALTVSRITVKQLKEQPNEQARSLFANDLLLTKMATGTCTNILNMVMVNTEVDLRAMMLDSVPLGVLFNLLESSEQPLARKVQMILDVAQAFEHLDRLGIVHARLTTRACFVTASNVVKVGDFSWAFLLANLSVVPAWKDNFYDRFVAGRDDWFVGYEANEVLSGSCRRSRYSDRWAFGVLLWQIFSNGASPYEDQDSAQIMQMIMINFQLDIPIGCPPYMYEIARGCWSQHPESRPSFDQLAIELRIILAGLHSTLHLPQPTTTILASELFEEKNKTATEIIANVQKQRANSSITEPMLVPLDLRDTPPPKPSRRSLPVANTCDIVWDTKLRSKSDYPVSCRSNQDAINGSKPSQEQGISFKEAALSTQRSSAAFSVSYLKTQFNATLEGRLALNTKAFGRAISLEPGLGLDQPNKRNICRSSSLPVVVKSSKSLAPPQTNSTDGTMTTTINTQKIMDNTSMTEKEDVSASSRRRFQLLSRKTSSSVDITVNQQMFAIREESDDF